ncbi:DUF1697 domain-containing protein [Solilutibacter silvestris]|uniref:DUF1697 domain-containing protein n=1 Tax=Solilutibacter silvestris TaxID=1645665 RepID=UPI003D339CE1
MARFVAFLRGVSPMNAKMPELKRSFEQAGFGNVRTLLSSGNVVFDARGSEATLVKKAEAAMEAGIGRTFRTQVRSVEYLQALLDADPFAAFKLAKDAKRVVTFIPQLPTKPLALPIEKDGARILALRDRELLTAYVPMPGNPAFMALIEKTFGKDVTTRTWDTVAKCAAA